MKRYVVGFAFDQGQVLLIEKKRPEWQAGRLNGVGGKIEPGEEPVAAMVREFEEEVGRKTTPDAWRQFARLYGDGWEVWFYRAEVGSFAPRAVTDEVPSWVDVSRVATHRLVIPNLRYLVPMAGEDNARGWPFEIGEGAAVLA